VLPAADKFRIPMSTLSLEDPQYCAVLET